MKKNEILDVNVHHPLYGIHTSIWTNANQNSWKHQKFAWHHIDLLRAPPNNNLVNNNDHMSSDQIPIIIELGREVLKVEAT